MIIHNSIAHMTKGEWSKTHGDYKGTIDGAKTVMALRPETHGTRLFRVSIHGEPRRLECSCCGGDAGRFAQWHNQDTGYGMCARCVDDIVARGPEYMERHCIDIVATWGIPGVHRAPAQHETIHQR